MDISIRLPRLMKALAASYLVLASSVLVTTQVLAGPIQEGADSNRSVSDAEIQSHLAEIIREQMEDKQIPAISIALVDGEQIVMSAGFGFQDSAKTKPASAETIYRVGSVSKLFTDLAMMQLVDAGSISLDEPISTYLDDVHPLAFNAESADDFAEITLRQLMSHRSGLVRESPVGHYFDPTEPSLKETVQSLNSTRLVYAPGTRTKYSNAGIAVIGYLLEKQLGKPFPEAIQGSVLQPLGMSSSGFEVDEDMQSRLAEAEMWSHDGRTFAAPTWKLGTSPAGNLYSSVEDMTHFIQAIFRQGEGPNGRLLSTERFSSMLTPQFADSANSGGFGLGFHLDELDEHLMIGHGGAVYGFATQLAVLPDQKVGVIVACSKDVANSVTTEIAHHALRSVLASRNGQPLPTWSQTTAIPAERAKLLDGLYEADNGDRVQFIERNGDLLARHGSSLYRLKQLSNNLLISDDVHRFGDRFELSSDQGFRFINRDYKRIESPPKPSELPSEYRNLVGEYGWDHNTLFIFERDEKLHCLIEWCFYYPLTKVSENTYAFPDYGLYHGEQLIFESDKDSAASAVIAAEVRFERRDVGTEVGATFKIDPIAPIESIREAALKASPPSETGTFRESDLVDVTELDDSIQLDIRYATTNNFMGSKFYLEPRAFMQRPAAEAVVRAHKSLKPFGYGLLIHDAYRPWHVTKMFWDATPVELKMFVANPANGSRHNRGCAVDLTLFDLETGKPIWMGAGYDEFSPRSFPDYEVDSSTARWHRELLRDAMEAQGFTIYEYEWWHFDFQDWNAYRIQNTRFEDLP